ncbi:GtrA family protein [Gordonia pseudamarae]|uniref:GtrA family protein n=1 Tax=Gordonia pseudamarae TaxID=2831662 RepID=A0ABX6IHK9_9ACTN|nr:MULTISPECIES: GtrA family protein [Gordonia]MBD0023334.1 GtrA family protein [Gordonia sp. (in: high G+C Gram-positive bacteria)]QHN25853.1 GtrA family protein [Gordonia pseudamarae]QHN34783.1 GtrA family protein [Gordonia pseudamarae]
MPFIDELVDRLPGPLHKLAMRHHELIKFALVGGTTFVVDMAIYYTLSLTVLEAKPVIAKIISGVLATVLSYVLNREWAFKNRGGRERHHEALLFFAISGVGVGLQAAPLWFANNVFNLRANLGTLELAVVDFVLGFIIGNLLQMGFRFWALRKFAFPEATVALLGEIHADGEIEPGGGSRPDGETGPDGARADLTDEELDHG